MQPYSVEEMIAMDRPVLHMYGHAYCFIRMIKFFEKYSVQGVNIRKLKLCISLLHKVFITTELSQYTPFTSAYSCNSFSGFF